MNDDPERRALAQPAKRVAAAVHQKGVAGPAPLTHDAGASDEPHERHAVAPPNLCVMLSWCSKRMIRITNLTRTRSETCVTSMHGS